MLTVEEALERFSLASSRWRRSGSRFSRALGRVLAEPIVSRRGDSAVAELVDGRLRGPGGRHGTGRRARSRRAVEAGALPPARVGAGEAMRIFTGAPLPDGADAVIPQEDVEAVNGRIDLRGSVRCARPTCGRRARTSRVGDRVLEPGSVLSAAEIGLLATLGYGQVRVYRRPRVAILSTGNELADLGTEPGPGQIPNTNTYSLMAQVLEAGGEPVSLGVAPDRLEAIAERVARRSRRRHAGVVRRRVGRGAGPGAQGADRGRAPSCICGRSPCVRASRSRSGPSPATRCSACRAIRCPRW